MPAFRFFSVKNVQAENTI